MHKAVPSLIVLSALAVLAGCERPQGGEMAASMGSHPAGEVLMTLPVTTSVDAAMDHYKAGLHAQDMGHSFEANDHFEKAVEADPSFALGYLRAATSAASTEEFTAHLAKAVELSANASPSEQLMIRITQLGFENNADGQLATAKELVAAEPESPRALLMLAGIQTGLTQVADSRETLAKAIALAPDFAAAHMQAGNNYLFQEPKDFAKAEEHFKKAIDLAPNEPNPYDLLGDVHRAQGNLEAAYQDYTMAAERAPDMGSPLQQRGHVNSFLGKYDEARADYDKSMEMEMARGNNNAPFFAVFRAYVNLHEGDHKAAIAELNELAAKADAMDVEGKRDIKINALTNVVQIATHHGDYAAAQTALKEMAELRRQQAKEVGTDQFANAQEANIAFLDGMLAARQGNAKLARAKASEFEKHVANVSNPRKLERMHTILGMSDFYQKNYADAAKHLAAGNPNSDYNKYFHAVALAESGQSDQANKMFQELAVYNFNSVGYAMTRADIMKRATM